MMGRGIATGGTFTDVVGLSTEFHPYANVIYRPSLPNPLPPKRGERG
jgi:hypothetical protein